MSAFLQHDCGCGCADLSGPCADCAPGCPVPVVPGTAASGQVGVPFSHYIYATNSPTSYSASPLPAGLSLSGNHISGTPTTAGVTNTTIGAANACGWNEGSSNLAITIAEACPISPTLVCDTIAASQTKCGFAEYPGHVSSPPKMYLTRAWSGAVGQVTYQCTHEPAHDPCGSSDLVETYKMEFSGTCTYSRPSCETPTGNAWQERRDGAATDSGGDCVGWIGNYLLFCGGECVPTLTATTAEWIPNSVCQGSSSDSHRTYTPESPGTNPKEVLSNEYTTAQLITDAESALPSYPGTWAGTCEAIRDMESDETSYSIQRFKYKFQLPDMTGITAAGITWKERFTPASGGSPTDTARSYTWAGTATATGEYTVNEPSTNGSIEIVDVVMTCT